MGHRRAHHFAGRLLKPGGFIAFDDYGWTLAHSKALRPLKFPLTGKLYTDEQIKTPQVEMIFDLLMRRDDRYVEVVPDRVWRKVESRRWIHRYAEVIRRALTSIR